MAIASNRRPTKQLLRGNTQRGVIEQLESRTFLNAADLDSTFGAGGLASTSLNGYGLSNGYAAALQTDGKTVVAGEDYSTGVESVMTVSRYNTNGTLDTTFGTGGEVQINMGTYAVARAVAIQADGKIVVAGSSGPSLTSSEFAVARLTTSGALDTTFNSTGTEIVAFGGTSDIATSVAIQSDGKIILGGGYSNTGPIGHFALARLNANGGLDSTYGTGGLVTTTITTTTPSDDAINGIAIDSNGDVVATGFVGTSISSSFGVARYTTAGTLDTTFGTNGVVVTNVGGGGDHPAGITIQSDGKIVVAGTSGVSFAAARYTTAGVLDTSYGNGGQFLYTTNTDVCTGVQLMSNGDIVLIGNSEVNSTQGYYPTMVRVGPTGGYDGTYGTNGAAILSSNIVVYGGIVRSNGVVDAVGYSPGPANQYVVQFTSTGVADTTFGSAGVEATDFSVPVLTYPRASALQSDGKLIVAGTFYQGAGTTRERQGFVARYNINGTLDTTFGTAGIVTIAPSKLCDLSAVVVQSNGDVVVEGSVQDVGSTSQYIIVERLLPSGAVDTTFATNGVRTFNAADGYLSNETATALLLQSDGKILAMNNDSNGGWITRLTTTGSLDTSYGESATGLERTTGEFWAATLDSSGRVIIGGGNYLARYTTGGTLDSTFNASSSVNVFINSGAADGTIALQPDGKILVAGSSSSAQIERFNVNGSADTSFGSQGVVTANLSNATFTSVTVLPNGDILGAGAASGGFVVNAYDSSGAPITSFGNDGSQIIVSPNSAYAVNAIIVRSNGKIIVSGRGTSAMIAQLVGDPPAVIPGTSGNDSITLTQDPDHAHIDWTLGTTTGQVLITDAAGLLINGNGGADTITLVGTNGSALPNALHLDGVGTTLIVQVLSFDISRVAPLFILIGVMMFRRGGITRTRDLGRVGIGLGLLLIALSQLLAILTPFEDVPSLRLLLGMIATVPVIDVIVGAALTWAAHSSVAIVLLTMSFAAQGILPPQAAFALVLGANLGTALNPLFEAGLTGDPSARRLPIGNLLNRLVGCLLGLALLGVIGRWLVSFEPDASRAVADFHTLFNLVMAALFYPVLGPLARLLRRLLPARAVPSDPSRPVYLDNDALEIPAIAIAAASREALRMADVLETMIRAALEGLDRGDRKSIAETKRLDDVLDRLNSAIKAYLTSLDHESIDGEDDQRLSEVLAFITNLEHAGDIVERGVAANLAKRAKRNLAFSREGTSEIHGMLQRLATNVRTAAAVFMTDDARAARELLGEKEVFRDLETRATEAHFARIRAGRVESVETSALHLDLLRDLKRINAHIAAAAYPVLEKRGELLSSRLRQDT